MSLRDVYEAVGDQEWLEAIADALQPAVRGFFDGLGPARRRVKNFLNGTWLGHPLHPVLTDIPIGAWSVTLLLDALDRDAESGAGSRGLRRAADASLALGLAGAVASAVSGLTDWADTDARPRRVGTAHALLNSTATLLFAASFLARRKGRRPAGRGLAWTGLLVAGAAGYLGGELVSHEQIGVDHSSGRELPEKFTPVLPASDLGEDEPKRVLWKDTPILLVKRAGRVFALAETCAHLGGPLAEGKLRGDCIVCPWHGSTFDLATGMVVEGPSAFPQPRLEARVRSGNVEVRVPRPNA